MQDIMLSFWSRPSWVWGGGDKKRTMKPRIYTTHTVCPESSDLFYIASLLYKMGHYFLDILHNILF